MAAADFAARVRPMAFDDAIRLLPTEPAANKGARAYWCHVVSSCSWLMPVARLVGLKLVQEFMNRDCFDPRFNSAWASHTTLAKATGYSQRHVFAALQQLIGMGLLAVEKQGGDPGRGGWTDRYTIRWDQLVLLEPVAAPIRGKDRKRFLAFSEIVQEQRPEMHVPKARNLSVQDRKKLPTTTGDNLKNNLSVGSAKKESWTGAISKAVTNAAAMLGDGNLAIGYDRLNVLGPGHESASLAFYEGRLTAEDLEDRVRQAEMSIRKDAVV